MSISNEESFELSNGNSENSLKHVHHMHTAKYEVVPQHIHNPGKVRDVRYGKEAILSICHKLIKQLLVWLRMDRNA